MSLIVVALLLLQNPVPPLLPPVEAGVIDGEPAILFWPRDPSGKLLDPADCTVAYETYGRPPADVQRRECGEWFKPARGRHQAWVETPTAVSRRPLVFTFGGGAFQGRGARSVALVHPAARVRLTSETDRLQGHSLRVISVSSEVPAYERRFFDVRSNHPYPVAAGRALLGLFASNDEAIAISRVLDLKGTQDIEVAMEKPASKRHVLLIAKPADPSRYYVKTRGGRVLEPIELAGDSQRVLVWYDLVDAEHIMQGKRSIRRLAPGTGITTIRFD